MASVAEAVEQGPKLMEVLTLVALLLGPILAIWVTREVDKRRERHSKRIEIFKILMRTRSTRLHPDHVGALNLVEIEFYKEQKVQLALEKYFQHLNDRAAIAAGTWNQNYDHLFTKLLSAIASSLGYQIEQLQILTGGYAPQGWEAAEKRGMDLQDKLIALLDGKLSLPVRHAPVPIQEATNANAQTTQAGLVVPHGFPPPPTGT
jgi:hypothetical protein